MSVASRNPFALLDEDAPTSTPQKAAPAPAPAPAPTTKDAQKNRTTPASRGGKYYNRGGKANTVKDTNAAPADDPVEGQRKFDGPGRGGRGRGRGGRGGRGSGDRPPRGRQFDRHSGTGKVDTDKQTHQAWGGDDGNQERQVEEQAAKDASAEAATPTVEEPADGEAATQDRPARREREPEEDDNTLTLDQYLAQKKESDIVPKLSTTRRANEGVDEEAWKNTVQLTKNEEDEAYFIGKTKTTHKSRNKKEEKVYLEIDAHFDRPSRGGRGGPDRGGRGRGGRGGRGGNRGTSNGRNAATFDVGDESAFPSLT